VATVSLAARQVRSRHRIMVIRATGAVLGPQDHRNRVTAAYLDGAPTALALITTNFPEGG